MKLREIGFDDVSEGFVLALVKKRDQHMLLNSKNTSAKDIEAKIRKEAEYFEMVFRHKLMVVAHVDCLESSASQ